MQSPTQTNMVVEERDQSTQEEPMINAHDEHVATSSNVPITDKNTSIIKGKRTKRQRPQSPISFCLNLNADDNDNNNNNNNNNKPESEESRSDICINIQEMNTTNTNTSILLSDDSHAYKTKEEEELEEYDIANCLILLAQGLPRYLCENSNNDDHYNYKQPAGDQKKFTSKKFMETPYGDKAGYYVYECKTCFKTFPSFQALGGHRASHMKPKKEEERTNNLVMNDAQCLSSAYNVDNHYNYNINNQANLYSSTSSNNNKKARIHECSTCGAEFLSGQALGGHMRRHRAPLGARIDNNNNNNIIGGSRHNHNENYFSSELPPSLSFKTTMMVNTANMVDDNGKPPLVMEDKKLFLNLDLNLAAPQEDESSKIHLATKD